jgi:hypothetical protein
VSENWLDDVYRCYFCAEVVEHQGEDPSIVYLVTEGERPRREECFSHAACFRRAKSAGVNVYAREPIPEPILFGLTHAEALVLFDFMVRFERTGQLSFDHLSEEMVLSKLQGFLERELSEPFRSDYYELVQQARREVSGDLETDSIEP